LPLNNVIIITDNSINLNQFWTVLKVNNSAIHIHTCGKRLSKYDKQSDVSFNNTDINGSNHITNIT